MPSKGKGDSMNPTMNSGKGNNHRGNNAARAINPRAIPTINKFRNVVSRKR